NTGRLGGVNLLFCSVFGDATLFSSEFCGGEAVIPLKYSRLSEFGMRDAYLRAAAWKVSSAPSAARRRNITVGVPCSSPSHLHSENRGERPGEGLDRMAGR